MYKDENGVHHYHYEEAMKKIAFLLEIEEYKAIYFDVLNETSRLDDLIYSYQKSVKRYQDEVWELKEIIGQKNKEIRELKGE